MPRRTWRTLSSRAGSRWAESTTAFVITVEDARPGIPEHLTDRLFQPFKRGPATDSHGMGLGLSLVSRFAQLHGGRAWVEQRPHGGASFRVFLPSGSADAHDDADQA